MPSTNVIELKPAKRRRTAPLRVRRRTRAADPSIALTLSVRAEHVAAMVCALRDHAAARPDLVSLVDQARLIAIAADLETLAAAIELRGDVHPEVTNG